MRRTRWLALVLLVGLGACGLVARAARGDPAWRVIAAKPSDFGLTAARVDMQSRDHRRVAGWWIAASPDRRGRATVILVHGRGANRGAMLPRAKFLVAAGYDVLAIDLRAHGDSEGEYTSPGYLEATEVETAIEFARRTSPRPVVLLGHSLGAVAVLHATSRRPAIAATIADSAYISPFDLFGRLRERLREQGAGLWPRIGLWFAGSRSLAGVLAWMVEMAGGDDVDARRAELLPVLPRIARPVLFITGDRDDLAPPVNARRMAAAVPVRGTWVVELPAGHQTFDDAPAPYERAVLGFLALVVPDPIGRTGVAVVSGAAPCAK